jgi:hypothetical protein
MQLEQLGQSAAAKLTQHVLFWMMWFVVSFGAYTTLVNTIGFRWKPNLAFLAMMITVSYVAKKDPVIVLGTAAFVLSTVAVMLLS